MFLLKKGAIDQVNERLYKKFQWPYKLSNGEQLTKSYKSMFFN